MNKQKRGLGIPSCGLEEGIYWLFMKLFVGKKEENFHCYVDMVSVQRFSNFLYVESVVFGFF